MLYKNTLIGSLFITTIVLLAWTSFWSYRSGSTPMHADATPKADAYMEDVHTTIMNKFGKPSLKIAAPKWVHFAKNNTSELTLPQLTLYRDSPQPWYITSTYANATQGIENVEFQQNVVVQHAADTKNPETIIKTLSLTVHPNQKIAETAGEITMTQPSIVVKATGMIADMDAGNIKLLSQARGEYAPS